MGSYEYYAISIDPNNHDLASDIAPKLRPFGEEAANAFVSTVYLRAKIANRNKEKPAGNRYNEKLDKIIESEVTDKDIRDALLRIINTASHKNVHLGRIVKQISSNVVSGFAADGARSYADFFSSGLAHLNCATRDKSLSTPKGLAELSAEILGAKEGETVLDLCSGVGGFLMEVQSRALSKGEDPSKINLRGVEIDESNVAISRMNMEIIGAANYTEVIEGDALRSSEKAEKVFCNPPFAIKFKEEEAWTYLQAVSSDLWELDPSWDIDKKLRPSAEWLFALKAIASMKPGGKAIAVLRLATLFRGGAEAGIRKEIVNRGLLECIIELPSGMFAPESNACAALYVFSENNNGVRMVDASANFTKIRRSVAFDKKDISSILEMAREDVSSRLVSRDEIEQHRFDLSPKRYLLSESFGEGETPLRALAVHIGRGSNVSSADLEKSSTSKPTPFKHLMIKDLEDGQVLPDLTNLTGIDQRFDQYCLRDRDLVISAIGPQYKTAVINLQPEQRMLASGNLFFMRFDSGKVDPYYIQAYLTSEHGEAQLEAGTKYSGTPRLPIKELRGLRIPMKAMEEQRAIGAAFKEKLDEISKAKERLKKLRGELREIYQ